MTVESWWPLLLLLAIPLLWKIRRATTTAYNTRHLSLLTGIRFAAVALLALALMQPVVYWAGRGVSVVYLVDVSRSAAPSSIQSALQWIGKVHDAGRPEDSAFIAFGANARVFDSLDELTRVPLSDQGAAGTVDPTGTDLAGGLQAAMRSLSAGRLKRLVLVSDGNDTSGDLSPILEGLRQENIRVYTAPMSARTDGDSWIEDVAAPADVTEGERFAVQVHIDSQRAAAGEIELRSGPKTLARKAIVLAPGSNTVALDAVVEGETGPVQLEASARIGDDPFTENNVFRKSVVVLGPPRILYVEGHPESAGFLKNALVSQGFDVDVQPPDSLPADVARLDGYDAVILSDVDRHSLSDGQMQSIAAYVRELGGGLILAGGENVYGEGGYSGTPVEDALPVTFKATRKQSQGVAMVIVLDRSSSMAGRNMELAKEATKAPLGMLDDSDRYGVVAFDYNFRWSVRLQPLEGHRPEILEDISRIFAVGETNIGPALDAAYAQLSKPTDEIKHIILLSDGFSVPADFESLTRKILEAGITVSTVAVGSSADRTLLNNIAAWGKGRSYFAPDASSVPQLFSEETQKAKALTLHEEPFQALQKKKIDAFRAIDFAAAPPLLGFVSAKPRTIAEVILEAPDEAPLLARWRHGLGKAAAFTSDVKNRWAVNWIGWKSYAAFWGELVRDTMRRLDDERLDLQVVRDRGAAAVSIRATDVDGRFRNKLQTQVRVIGVDAGVRVVEVPQVGPGLYETRVPLTDKRNAIFRAIEKDGAGPSRALAYSYPEEYHFRPANTEKLRSISAETGGVFEPQGPEIFDAAGESVSIPIPLWPWLAGSVLALHLVDVFLRRLRLFERE